ncbi:MAG: RBBP9/YdeN family alpha/beta hydrolase [Frankia sp.]
MGSGPSRRFLVLHGWQNRRPPAHWQWQLVDALRATGEQVLYPQLPDPDRPSLEGWTELLHAELAQLGGGERVVIAHSLAVLLWLHAADGLASGELVTRVLLVSPPSPAVLAAHPEVAAFARIRPDPAAVARAAVTTRLVCGDNDPYCPGGAVTVYGALGLDTDVVPDGQHLDPDAGYGRWPSALAWCLDPTARLVPNVS